MYLRLATIVLFGLAIGLNGPQHCLGQYSDFGQHTPGGSFKGPSSVRKSGRSWQQEEKESSGTPRIRRTRGAFKLIAIIVVLIIGGLGSLITWLAKSSGKSPRVQNMANANNPYSNNQYGNNPYAGGANYQQPPPPYNYKNPNEQLSRNPYTGALRQNPPQSQNKPPIQ
jgi:hypothetical protein